MKIERFYLTKDFIYNVDGLINYLNKTKPQLYKIDVNELKDFTNMRVWDYKEINDEGLSVQDALDNPKKYKQHYSLIMKSNLKYPIIFCDGLGIVDGFHRLGKAMLLKNKYIDAYIINKKILNKFKLGKNTQKEWERIYNETR